MRNRYRPPHSILGVRSPSCGSVFFSYVFEGSTSPSLAALRFHRARYTPAVSLAEIKTAVDALSPDELTELGTFVRERDNAAWDRQIDSDFSENGRLSFVAEEVREDIRADRLREMP